MQAISTAIFETDNLQSVLDIILRRVCEVAGWVYGETLLKNSDIAMYHAKELGRNNYQFYVNRNLKIVTQNANQG